MGAFTVFRFLMQARKNRWLGPYELEKLQTKRFEAMGGHSYNRTALYHPNFRGVEIRPDLISGPSISVVIPLFNKADHISRALDSVFVQTFQNFEVIVIDDGSTDNGYKIVESYTDPRLFLIRQENQGVSRARNNGIKHASADIVTFLDADDEWCPQFLETLIHLRQKFPDAGMYATLYCLGYTSHMVHPKIRGMPSYPWEGILDSYFKILVMNKALPFGMCSVGILKSTLADVGLFNPGLQRGEDAELFYRIAMCWPIAYSTYNGAIYHQISENRATRKFNGSGSHFDTFISQYPKEELKVLPFYDDLCKYSEKRSLMTAYINIGAGEMKKARTSLSYVKSSIFMTRKLILMVLALFPFSLGKYFITLRLRLIDCYYLIVSSMETLQKD